MRPAISAAGKPATTLLCLVLAVLLPWIAQQLLGAMYLNMRDEGYLWYGVQAVQRGDVPLRDFQAYDPGRYYWCSFLGSLFGHHVIGVRASVAVFQGIGLFFGLCVLARVVPARRWLFPGAVLFVLWGFPRFKLFESSLTLIGVWGMVRLIERPSRGRFFAFGLVVGLAAFFGRNHGFYLLLASCALFVLCAWKRRDILSVRRLAAWALGIVVGYAPLLAMLLAVPGFAASFLEQVISVTSRGANIPEPFPWPWTWEGAELSGYPLAGYFAMQLGFLLPVVCLPLGLWRLARMDREEFARGATLVGALVVGGVYAHHYSIRSDVPHLAQAIPPVLILALALAGGGARASRRAAPVVLTLLLGQATVFALDRHPELSHYRPGEPAPELATYQGEGFKLRLKLPQTRLLNRVKNLLNAYVTRKDTLFIAPTHPTYYPLFEKGSPVWWIYFLWPASEEEQDATIRALEEQEVDWALIIEKPFSKKVEFDFRNTNPKVWEHLNTEWHLVDDWRVPEDYYFFRRPRR